MSLIRKSYISFGLLLTTILMLPSNAAIGDELKVVGLFKNGAMVQYHGKQKMLRVGQKLGPDIQLIAADTSKAEFLIAGKKVVLGLQSFSQFDEAAATAQSQSVKTVRVVRDAGGMFKTQGSINNVPVHFLIDTGATAVAMNEAVAQQIGLLYETHGKPARVSTAAGVVPAWYVVLDKVTLGSITLRNIDAIVVQGTGPREVLLGNSFLSKLKIEHSGQMMILSTHF